MTELTGVELLRDVQQRLAAAPENVRAQALARAAEAIPDLWENPLNLSANGRMESRVILAGVGHTVTPDRVTLIAANSMVPLSGGLVPALQWHGAEFGATRRYVDARFKGGTRRQKIGANFKYRRSKGYHAFHTARRNGPRIVASWVHGTVKGLTMGNPNMETS